MTSFMEWTGERHGRSFTHYSDLWKWSVTEIEEFWGDIWEYGSVRAPTPYRQVLASR